MIDENELDQLLFEITQIFDGWHSDGTAWSEYDEYVRQRIINFRRRMAFIKSRENEQY